MRRVYLDHAAGSPVRPQAAAAAAEALAAGGNPSSVHGEGRRARARIEAARRTIAETVGAGEAFVVFTSGATEALNLAIAGAMAAGASRRILVSAVEHDAVREAAIHSIADVEIIPVDARGVLDLAWLEARLAAWRSEEGRPLVAAMLANNETGVVQPVAEAARLGRAKNALMLVDAVQALGKIGVAMSGLGADYLALSGHKIGGPPGVGALVLGANAPLARRQHGGGQERGHRAGTENLPGIAGFAAAVEAAREEAGHWAAIGAARDGLEARLHAARPELVVLGADAPRLPTISSFALPGWSAEGQVMALDLAGVAVSAGAACSSGKMRPSQVATAMGLGEEVARAALRVSFGWNSRPEDAHVLEAAWLAAAARARPAAPSLALSKEA